MIRVMTTDEPILDQFMFLKKLHSQVDSKKILQIVKVGPRDSMIWDFVRLRPLSDRDYVVSIKGGPKATPCVTEPVGVGGP